MLCDGLNVRGGGQPETPPGSEESNLEAAVTVQSQSRRERKRKMSKFGGGQLNRNKGKLSTQLRLQDCVFECAIRALPPVRVEKR